MKRLQLSAGTLRKALPIAVAVGTVFAGMFWGIEVMLLVVAGGALLAVIALLWASVESLTGESPLTLEEALGMGAPSAEEEQKRAVLRALKDLEYERSVGKISDEDYHELSERYRQEAKRLMRALDENAEPARERVDKLVAERLARKDEKRARRESTDDVAPASRDEAPEPNDDAAVAARSTPLASDEPADSGRRPPIAGKPAAEPSRGASSGSESAAAPPVREAEENS